jgi:hypothetical protein
MVASTLHSELDLEISDPHVAWRLLIRHLLQQICDHHLFDKKTTKMTKKNITWLWVLLCKKIHIKMKSRRSAGSANPSIGATEATIVD